MIYPFLFRMIKSTKTKTFSIKLFHNLCQAIPKGAVWHPPFYRGFSGNTIKWIAIITMLLDHIAASVLLAYRYKIGYFTPSLLTVYEVLRDIGRVAFPLYVFLLIEGLQHTRNPRNYFFRLCFLALLSEIPFDLALHRLPWYPAKQNVCWTLAIGFFVIWGVDSMRQELHRLQKKSAGSAISPYIYLILLDAGLIGAGAIGAKLLNTDYSYIGVLAIVIAYVFRNYPLPQALATCLIMRISSEREWYALLAMIPMLYYNGKRGRQPRYFFYLFYPVHLLVLYLIIRTAGFV